MSNSITERELLRSLPAPTPTPNKTAYTLEKYIALIRSPRKFHNYLKYLSQTRRDEEANYYPIKLDIENVSRCNFRCGTCQVSEWPKGQRANDMSYETFCKIIDEQIGLIEIKLQGMGEPTIQGNDFFKMIRYARSKNIWVRTVTNASLLHLKDNYISLIDSGVNEVQISIDAADKEIFERIRPGSNFEKVKENCKLINRYAKKRDLIRTKMWTVVQQKNISKLEPLVACAAELGFTRQVFSIGLVNWGQDKWLKHNNSENEINGQFTFELGLKLLALGKKYDVEVQFWSVLDKYKIDLKENLCAWPFERAYISSDNKIVPCCMVANPDSFQIGNGTSLKDIWNSEEYKKFRRSHLEGDIPKICTNCYEE
jgi:radical SAM protein with 4Fe4S-binding SPASM domain